MFGFRGSLASEAVPDQALQLANAHALGNAMLVLLLAPWGFDFIFYCGARQLPHSVALSGQPFIVCIEGLPIDHNGVALPCEGSSLVGSRQVQIMHFFCSNLQRMLVFCLPVFFFVLLYWFVGSYCIPLQHRRAKPLGHENKKRCREDKP